MHANARSIFQVLVGRRLVRLVRTILRMQFQDDREAIVPAAATASSAVAAIFDGVTGRS